MKKTILIAIASAIGAASQPTHLSDLKQLTHGGQNAEAYWSPDGKRLIFQTTRPPYDCDQMFVMNADGTDQHLVSTGKGRTTCGYFLADNKHIVYGSTHLAGEMLGDLLGIKLTHIPYKGTPPAMLDVSSGQVSFMFDQMTAALPLLQSGKLKLLAVTTARRMALAPELPTMAQAGVPGFEMASWQAVYAPKNLPPAISQRLAAEITRILQQPEVRDKLTNQLGMEVVAGSPAQLAALMQKEIPRWGELVRKSGASAN